MLWGHEQDVNDLQDRDKNQDGAHTDCPLRKSEHYPPTSKRTCVAGQHHCENAHESQIPQRRPGLGHAARLTSGASVRVSSWLPNGSRTDAPLESRAAWRSEEHTSELQSLAY